MNNEIIKQSLVHIHDGILFSYEKETIRKVLVSSNEGDETGAYYTE